MFLGGTKSLHCLVVESLMRSNSIVRLCWIMKVEVEKKKKAYKKSSSVDEFFSRP